MLPAFEPATGYLPQGEYEAIWPEFCRRFGSTEHRRALLAGLRAGAESLASLGCRRLWVDGSFVTAKADPADFDACWDTTGVDILEVERADPCILDLNGDRSGQKAKYHGVFWPAFFSPMETPGRTMLENFQWDRDGRRKGIVLLRLPLDESK